MISKSAIPMEVMTSSFSSPQTPQSSLPTSPKQFVKRVLKKKNGNLGDSSKRMASPNQSKNFTDFGTVNSIPIIIKDAGYLKRKLTFDTFLRQKDLEILLGISNATTKATTVDRGTTINNINVLHSKMRHELDSKIRQKKGKMYSNELWSIDYYSNVISTSSLKKKYENIMGLKYKSIDEKNQEFEQFYKKREDKYTGGMDLKLMKSFDHFKPNVASFNNSEIREFPAEKEEEVPPQNSNVTSPKLHGQRRVLNSFLRIEDQEHKVQIPAKAKNKFFRHSLCSTPNSAMLSTATDLKASRGSRRLLSPESIQLTSEKEYEENSSAGLLSEPSPTNTGASGNRFARSNNTSRNGRNALSPFPSFYEPPRRSNFSRNGQTFGVINTEPNEVLRTSTLQDLPELNRKKSPRIIKLTRGGGDDNRPRTESENAKQKLQVLINQCNGLGEENKEFKKEMLQQRKSLVVVQRKRENEKDKQKKNKQLFDALARKAAYIQELHKNLKEKIEIINEAEKQASSS